MTIKRKARPCHPGEILADILEEHGISQAEFAERIGVSHRTVNQIINGRRPVTVDTAYRLSHAFGNSPQFWLNLQLNVDMWDILQTNKKEYAKIERIKAA